MTKTEIKPLNLAMDEEMRTQSNNILDGYTVSNKGQIYDPEGNEVKYTGYRGKKVTGIRGYMVFVDWAVAKAFLGKQPHGYYIEHIDGDLLNNDVDNLRWKPRSPYYYTKKKQPKEIEEVKEETKRPQGWIRRYSMDGILIREYADVDQLVYECVYFGEVSEASANNIPSVIRRTHKFPERYRHYLGSSWKVSDPSVLDSKKFGIHPERYNGHIPTTMEFTPATSTWIKRYVGPFLVQTFTNIDEAVDYVSKAFGARQQQTRQRLTDFMRGESRDKTIYGSTWEASGEEALVSAHTEDYGGRPAKEALPAVEEVKTTKEEKFKEIEPIEEVKRTKQTSDRPEVEVIVEGDVESVKVTMEADNRIRIVLRAR